MDVSEPGNISCPKCGSQSAKYIPEMDKYFCLTCTHLYAFTKEQELKKLKIFLSYGHDVFAEDVSAIKKDLESRGHVVWYDVDQLLAGRDFEIYIENGLKWCDLVVVVMTPHSVRREETSVGYCLNEIAKALDLNRRIIPVYLVTVAGEAPTSICRLGYVDMRDCVHFRDFPEKYRNRFAHLISAIENDIYEGDGAQSRLLRLLKPLAFEAEMGRHLARFTGRHWVTLQLENWLKDTSKKDSRVFWLLGGAGIGKSAIASHWCHTRGDVIAYHLCVYGHSEKADPRRILLSIAAQMAMHLPEYFRRLSALPLEELVDKNAKAIFDDLLVAPLRGNFPNPDKTLLVIIDALDEASHGTENELADFIAESWGELPSWLKLIITSRPEANVMTRLAILQPWPLVADRAENLEDIREYLKREFAIISMTVSASQIDQIVNKSEGLFLYANLMLEEVRAGRLQAGNLSDFPDGLAGYYTRWFGREFTDLQEYEHTYHRLVSTIVAQRAPLPLEVLGEALQLTLHELRKRLQKLAVLFPQREDRSDGRTMTYIIPLHKSLRDWLTEPIAGTQVPKAGNFAADVELGDQLLAELGWTIYQEQKVIANPYYSRALLRHMAGTGQTNRLIDALLDGELLENLWIREQRCEWLRHMNILREMVPLGETLKKWLVNCSANKTLTVEDASRLATLSRLLQQLGAYDESVLIAEEAIRIWEFHGVQDSPAMVQSLLSMGTIYRLRDEYDMAQPFYDRALTIAEGIHDVQSRELADVLYELCVFHKEKRNYEKSWDCLNRSLAIRKQMDPPDYAGLADCINDQAVLLKAEGKPGDYLGIFREALALFEKGYPDGHPEMVTTLNNIAMELEGKGKMDEAMVTLQRGLKMAESLLAPYHIKCQSLRNDLADLLYQKEKYQEALNIMRNQVKQAEIFPGPDHEDTAEARLRLCQAIRVVLWSDENAPTEKLKAEVREQCSKVFRAHPRTVIGFLYTSDNFYLAAEFQLAQSLWDAGYNGAKGNADKVRKESSENVASACFFDIMKLLARKESLLNLENEILQIWDQTCPGLADYGDLLARMRRHVVSLLGWAGHSRLRRLQDVNEVYSAFDLITGIGADTPVSLDVLATLTLNLHHLRYFGDSERLCRLLLDRSEKMLGPDHLQTISYVGILADLCEHLGKFDEAIRLYRRTFEVRSRISGNENSDTLFSLCRVAKCMFSENHFDEAAAFVQEFIAQLPNTDASDNSRQIIAARLGNCAIELKNELSAYKAAQMCNELSLELNPMDAQIHSNLALLLWSCLHDVDAADQHFRKAVQLNPDNWNLLSNYGLFLTHALRDYNAAKQHFEKALLLNPSDSAVTGNYTTLLIVEGNLDKAWIMAKRTMHLCLPTPDRIMARSLFCAIAILMLKDMEIAIPLGQMKTLFKRGIDHVAWVIDAMLEKLDQELNAEQDQLMHTLLEAMNDQAGLIRLDQNKNWAAIAAEGLELSWPDLK
jgi:tetratricopeptide (TPR) repeat protein